MIGDVFGSPGRNYLAKMLPSIRAQYNIDFVVVNGENTTHGKSILKKHYDFYKELGIDVITSGNHIYKIPEVKDYIGTTSDLLKPLNFNVLLPGNGTVEKTVKGHTIRITNLMGRVFMNPSENPYVCFDKLLLSSSSDIHIVDFHAEATSEKAAFAWNYDGQITALVGTHTHVPTADARLLPKGTAFITDLGMTGPLNSIIGANPTEVIAKEKYGSFSHFKPAKGPCQLSAAVISIDLITKKATNIQLIVMKE